MVDREISSREAGSPASAIHLEGIMTTLASVDGRIGSPADFEIPIYSESALRGANVFEGIRVYSGTDGRMLAFDRHIERLFESARLMRIHHRFTLDEVRQHSLALLDKLRSHDGDADFYLRPSIVVVDGRLPQDDNYRSVLYISATGVPRNPLDLQRTAIVSKYRRPLRGMLPAAAKSGGSYLQFRLPLDEQRRAGADHVIVLNELDRVAEAEGAAVITTRGSVFRTPPIQDSALDSVTKHIVHELCLQLGFAFEIEPISLWDLYTCDLVFLAGTLCELVPISDLDGYKFGMTDAYMQVASAFDAVRCGRGASNTT